ncbi:MAG: methionyl-tRNA synthetase [Bathelium mastoideum]|nr:MAG: methionyl-tRNA synthetase [Bathelium mastoideum]KAI9693928.1 MAG: methionyl-tRNA synthetase [Bathelium mastoideum]
MLLADMFKRWWVLQGKHALLCTGTDEHGMKIQQAAAKAQSDPKLFCDRGADTFKALASRLELTNDYFIRTTDQNHRDAVQFAWTLLEERGYIYTAKHEGWYSISDETFYPQSAVHLIVDPPTGRKMMVSMETGTEVNWQSETNYHFKLSEFREPLLKFYEENPQWVVPQARMDQVVKAVSEGLSDLSISRPAERLTWGIPVPNDDTQTIYVWLDALTNYITKAGFPWAPGQGSATGWPADVHVIGKDIIRFHCIYWPAFLMALDIPLPKNIVAHAHWTLSNKKMSKSTGNVVDPFFALDRFGIDVMRFYMAYDGGLAYDADYSNYTIIERYKKVLQGGLGNLTSRIVRGKGWDLGTIVEFCTSSSQNLSLGDLHSTQKSLLDALPTLVRKNIEEECNVRAAVQAIFDVVFKTNKYISDAQPWKLVDKPYRSSKSVEQPGKELAIIVYLAAETLRKAGILLQPFMPNKAALMLDMLGVDEQRRTFEWATEVDDTYGMSRVDLGEGVNGVLFPPLQSNS